MKKFARFAAVILVLSLVLGISAYATSTVEPRGSAFFDSYGTDLYRTSPTTFQIWFDVDSNARLMDELGVSLIELYRSPDQQTWTKVKTYEPEDYPEMIDINSYSYINYVPYTNAWAGYYYTACITFYAKNSTGIGERDVYTEIMKM